MTIALMAMMIGVRFMFDDADGRTRMSDGQDEPTRWRLPQRSGLEAMGFAM